MVGLVKGKRGAVTVQVALFLPIFIMILVGAFEVWKVMYLQQVLNDAAYQGVRLMVTQANAPAVDGQTARNMKDEAEALVRRYVSSQTFVYDPQSDSGDPLYQNPMDPSLSVQFITDGYPPVCGSDVQIVVTRQWLVGRGSTRSEALPFLGRLGTMRGYARGIVVCEREEDVTGGN